jgi:hypothetical protein
MESSEKFIREKTSAVKNKIYVKAIQLHPQAEVPTQENGDLGWVVTLVGRTENRAEDDFGDMNGFCTGLQLCPPDGYYLEVLALPALYKHGYNLASGPIIIGPNNKDELVVPLMKFRETNDLELPIQAVQILVKAAVPAFMSKTKNTQHKQDNVYAQFMPSSSQSYVSTNPMNAGYRGDMDQYQAFAQSQQGRTGNRRPTAAAPRQNHMF